MKITIYDLIKLIKEDKAPEKVLYDENIYFFEKDCQDYKNSFNDEYLISEICTKITWLDEEVEIIGQSENEFTGCKWFVRGKETMSMEYEDSENWFKAKELIESLASIEKTEEKKDIEEIVLDVDDFMDVNFKKTEKAINELVRAINSINKKLEL